MGSRIAIAVIIICILTAAACGPSNRTKVGTITQKEYEAEHTEDLWLPLPVGKIIIPWLFHRHYNAHWDFKLELCDNTSTRCKHGEVAVNEETYNSYNEGDYYPR